MTAAGIRIVNSILLSTFGSVDPVKRIPFAEMLSVIAAKTPSDVLTSRESFIGKRTAVRKAFVIDTFNAFQTGSGPEFGMLDLYL